VVYGEERQQDRAGSSFPFGITVGPDGNLWFTELLVNRIGRITPTGTITKFPLPVGASPQGTPPRDFSLDSLGRGAGPGVGGAPRMPVQRPAPPVRGAAGRERTETHGWPRNRLSWTRPGGSDTRV